MDSRIDYFDDVRLHAIAVRDWNQTYSQITAGSLHSSLARFIGPRVQIVWEQLNQRVVQHGEAPRGRVCVALPLSVPGAAHVQGCEPDDRSIFILNGGGEFTCHTPVGWEVITFSFDRDFFEQAVDQTPWPDEINRLFRRPPVVKVSPDRLARSRDRLLALFAQALVAPGTPGGIEADDEFERALLQELLCMVIDPECDKAQRHRSSPGSFIVEKCHRLTIADAPNPPTISDLCQRMRVSRRAVQRSFRHIAQTTPVNYIRSIRLNAVRRELANSRASEVTIGDAAARWGFFHLSHFASDYKALFGELPSQTRRLAARSYSACDFANVT